MTGAPASNEAAVYAHLAGDGLPLPDIAGIMGNLQVESGFNPGATNPGEGAVGLAQWEGGRKTQLDALASARGTSDTDLNTQLAFLDQELQGPYASVLAAMRSTTDPATAAQYFDVGPGGTNSGTGFENSSGAADGVRQSFAQSIYAQISGGQVPTGGGAVASSSATNATLTSQHIGGVLDPLNWPGDLIGAAGNAASGAASSAAGSVLKVALPFATKVTFVIAGLGLVGLGVYRISQPARQQAEQVVQKAGPLAAAL